MLRAGRTMALVTLIAVAGCSIAGPDTPSDPDDTPLPEPSASADPILIIVSPGAAVDGPGISVPDAIASAGEVGEVLVNGSLFIDENGTVRLCDAIAESFPPQCGGARLEVRGLDLDAVPELQEANGVRWAEGIQLFGRVDA
jgi:hypothetical protein